MDGIAPMTTTTSSSTAASPHVSSLCYRGMEVILASDLQNEVVTLFCPRSYTIYQTLSYAKDDISMQEDTSEKKKKSDDDDNSRTDLLSIQSHSVSGQICLLNHHGQLFSYFPSSIKNPHSTHHWSLACIIDGTQYFSESLPHPPLPSSSYGGISLTQPGHVLVAWGHQLALFDAATNTLEEEQSTPERLLWMTQCQHPIQRAHISGHGQSIALVMEGDATDTAATEGVHTYQREASCQSGDHSQGLYYQPGPFLVHAARVTHLSYGGGYGRSLPPTHAAHDLCLTYAGTTARIFAHCHCLLEWNTPPHTHVGWIQCRFAWTLADLDPALAAPPADQEDDALYATKRGPYSSSPSPHHHHFPIPTTQAGAWIYEITLAQPAPQLRISRLTFLPRGLDEWHPTLETMAAVSFPTAPSIALPMGVEGLWPAWSAGPPCEIRTVTATKEALVLWESSVVVAPLDSWELAPPIPTALARPHGIFPSRVRLCQANWMAHVVPAPEGATTIALAQRSPAVLSLAQEDSVTSIRHWQDDSGLRLPVQWATLPVAPIDEAICALLFWSPSRLVARGQKGTVWVLVIPSAPTSVASFSDVPSSSISPAPSSDTAAPEYTVAITPDPEFGLGLRLEAPPDGIGAFVGSFKRHPSLGEALPAERCGRIHRGDVLLRVNEIDLAARTFDDIVTAVRDAAAEPGRPLRLQWRPAAARRSRAEMLGVRTHAPRRAPPEVEHTAAVTAVFPKVLPSLGTEETTEDVGARLALIPWDVLPERVASTVVWADQKTVSAALLAISESGDRDKAEWVFLGSLCVATNETAGDGSIVSVEIVNHGTSSCTVAVCTQMSQVYLVSMDMTIATKIRETSVSMESFIALDLKAHWSSGSILRAYSPLLLATMPANVHGSSDTIRIWSFSPRPGTVLEPSLPVDETVTANYFAADVCSESMADDDLFVDTGFLRTGTLDSYPSLVAYSNRHVTLYQKYRGSADWIPCTRISYHKLGPLETLSWGRSKKPLNQFPHLLQLLCSVHVSQDEATFLRSDWHAEALLAHICNHKDGPKSALLGSVRSVFLWLAAESLNGQDGGVTGSLIVAPLPIIENNSEPLKDSIENGDVMAALASRVKESPETTMIRDFLALLVQVIEHLNANQLSLSINIPKSLSSLDPENGQTGMSLPPFLQSASINELRMLWTIGEMVLDPPPFDGLDAPAQLFLFCCSFMEKTADGLKRIVPQTSKARSMPAHGVLVRSISSAKGVSADAPGSIASAGTLAALLSSDQAVVMKASRGSPQRMTWQFVRERRVAYWERSDAALAGLSEEIGSAIFLETRDVMECAIFYIIAGKMTTLQNLSKSDRSATGQMFAKFLTDYDFSSERGRRAAEKNAFSLLRKCRYQVASAFFLLANPPFLNAALETISTKLCDVDLAFFVARLVERSGSFGSAPSGFTGVLGGGGGYADVGMHSAGNLSKSRFSGWKPKLGWETQKLLVDRILPASSHDQIMTAICLLWLGKINEAAWFISRIVDVRYAGLTSYGVVKDASQPVLEGLYGIPQINRKLRQPLSMLSFWNAIIDFFSGAALLKPFGANSRVRVAASLVVSEALSAFGIELTSMRNLIDCSDLDQVYELRSDNTSFGKNEGVSSRIGEPNVSSIFDDFAAPPHRNDAYVKSSLTAAPSKSAQSSIFDGFDVQPPQNRGVPSGAVQSSIFDDFEVPPLSKKVGASEPSIVDPLQSSIFDDFAAPPVRKSGGSGSENIQSSIFDDFLVSPSASGKRIETRLASESQPLQDPVADTTHSSVFDEFDVRSNQIRTSIESMNTISQNGMGLSSDRESENVEDPLPNPQVTVAIADMPTPKLWYEWRKSLLLDAVSRRMLREVASVVTHFHGDLAPSTLQDFYESDDILRYSGAAEVLVMPCDPLRIMSRLREVLHDLSNVSKFSSFEIVQRSATMLGPAHFARMLFSVLLNLAVERDDRAEEVVRTSSAFLMQKCFESSLLHDDMKRKQGKGASVSSLFGRREAARLSWQLESCLWLHKGGGLALSSDTVKECTVAVRVGILLAVWNRDFDCIEAMIFNEPDCVLDEDFGRLLWASLKDIAALKGALEKDNNGDGWEFRVDCKRHQATELLRNAAIGCFLIRPNTDDSGVYTLSFKTNLEPEATVPPEEKEREYENFTPDTSGDEQSDLDRADRPRRSVKKKVRKDDVVQHAIIRLSDSGFRCGSFGPFTSLMSLLESVSSSLPFALRFDLPPKHHVYKEVAPQTSPNAVFFRKLNLHRSNSSTVAHTHVKTTFDRYDRGPTDDLFQYEDSAKNQTASFAVFAQLVVLCQLRQQFCKIAAYSDDDENDKNQFHEEASFEAIEQPASNFEEMNCDDVNLEKSIAVAFRMLHPILTWCRKMELITAHKLSPDTQQKADLLRVSTTTLTNGTASINSDHVVTEESGDAIEVSPLQMNLSNVTGDAILRGLIRPESGIDFSTLRLVDAGECTMLLLFSRSDALHWLITSGVDATEEASAARLERMEDQRVIESVDLHQLPLKHKSVDPNNTFEGVRYRFVDPWEVEAVNSREGETRSAALGRERYVPFSVERVAAGTTDHAFRLLGGGPLLELWSKCRGDALLTQALATLHPPWERAGAGDVQLTNGKVTEPPPFLNSIRRHLYRNALYRRLELPQRFVALIHVELLDLKNLTTPGGSLSLTAYALLRLKRARSNGILSSKARTIDSASTQPFKLNKTAVGPNAPASWGSLVRFRFPLPEDASVVDGTSPDRDRETLFKGPPRLLQISVYVKKLLADHSLGTADVNMDGLSADGGPMEEWVPLRSEKHGITWFARIRLTLRFELMCLAAASRRESIPSVGLQRIYELTHKSGGSVHEDMKQRSLSASDLKNIAY
jgi:RAVE protein 1 C terminal